MFLCDILSYGYGLTTETFLLILRYLYDVGFIPFCAHSLNGWIVVKNISRDEEDA